MKIVSAVIFRFLLRFKFFKKRYFGIHKRLFKPFNLFKGVIRKTRCNALLMSLHIDDNGIHSKNEINVNRMNYIFTTQTFANIK